VLQRLNEKGLTPAPQADRVTLIRRLFFDLLGLPPPPQEVERFVNDKSCDAYEELVDRLLASPAFGERMAMYWLDLVRYADTNGYHGDNHEDRDMYRDWVIRAFNDNMPFDRFTVEQLAGDLLPNATPAEKIASGYNRLLMTTREGGAQAREYMAKYSADRVRNFSSVWLAGTMGCCECHDHKFDPFSAKDFYSLGAFFADVKQWGVYMDYNYTPNPDLVGWSNDHPFPPEIIVDSPNLKRRLATLLHQIDQRAARSLREADANGRIAFAKWADDSTSYLKSHPDGWTTLAPIEPAEADKPRAKLTGENAVLLLDPPNAPDSPAATAKDSEGSTAQTSPSA